MPLPTFVIGGPPKAGTTALWAMLRAHPGVFMTTLKEPRFFMSSPRNPAAGVHAPGAGAASQEFERGYHRGLAWYESLFEGSEGYPVRGEASPQYIGAQDGPELMQRHVPGLKIIFVLRNPVLRAHSHYWHHRNRALEIGDGGEKLPPFAAALEDHPRLRYFLYMSRYRQHLDRYLMAFGPERVQLVLFDDLRNRPTETFAEICRFIGADDTFEPAHEREYNPAGAPVVGPLQRLLARTKRARWNYLPGTVRGPARRLRFRLEQWNRRRATYEPLEPELFERFLALFEEDVAYVEGLIRPLPEWRRR